MFPLNPRFVRSARPKHSQNARCDGDVRDNLHNSVSRPETEFDMLDDISRDGDDKLSFLSSNVNFDIENKPPQKRRARNDDDDADDEPVSPPRVGMSNIRKRAIKRGKNGKRRRKASQKKSTEGMSSLYSFEQQPSAELPVVQLTCSCCNGEVDLIHTLEQLDEHIESIVARRLSECEEEMRRELVEEFKLRRARAVASRED